MKPRTVLNSIKSIDWHRLVTNERGVLKMKVGIVLNTKDPETAWNALRLGNEVLRRGNEVSLFLTGNGVEIEGIRNDTFDVAGELKEFVAGKGETLARGTCLKVRHQQGGMCPVSNMATLADLVLNSDRVVTFG